MQVLDFFLPHSTLLTRQLSKTLNPSDKLYVFNLFETCAPELVERQSSGWPIVVKASAQEAIIASQIMQQINQLDQRKFSILMLVNQDLQLGRPTAKYDKIKRKYNCSCFVAEF